MFVDRNECSNSCTSKKIKLQGKQEENFRQSMDEDFHFLPGSNLNAVLSQGLICRLEKLNPLENDIS
jgi:hypothetical protein